MFQKIDYDIWIFCYKKCLVGSRNQKSKCLAIFYYYALDIVY